MLSQLASTAAAAPLKRAVLLPLRRRGKKNPSFSPTINLKMKTRRPTCRAEDSLGRRRNLPAIHLHPFIHPSQSGARALEEDLRRSSRREPQRQMYYEAISAVMWPPPRGTQPKNPTGTRSWRIQNREAAGTAVIIPLACLYFFIFDVNLVKYGSSAFVLASVGWR